MYRFPCHRRKTASRGGHRRGGTSDKCPRNGRHLRRQGQCGRSSVVEAAVGEPVGADEVFMLVLALPRGEGPVPAGWDGNVGHAVEVDSD